MPGIILDVENNSSGCQMNKKDQTRATFYGGR